MIGLPTGAGDGTYEDVVGASDSPRARAGWKRHAQADGKLRDDAIGRRRRVAVAIPPLAAWRRRGYVGSLKL